MTALRNPVLGLITAALILPLSNGIARGDDLGLDRSVPGAAAAERTPAQLSSADWMNIRAAHEAAQHCVDWVEGAARARNPGQGWSVRFDGRGFTVRPETGLAAGAWEWGLELQEYGARAAERRMTEPRAVLVEGPRIAYQWDSNLTEWYVNGSHGLEHGFTVGAAPVVDTEPWSLVLAVRGGLTARIAREGRDVRFVDPAGNTIVNYVGLHVFDAKGKALPAHFEPERESLRLVIDDRDANYPITIDPLAQQAYVKASNTGGNDRFGSAVAISGDTVVVGAFLEDSNAIGVNGNQADNSAAGSGAAYVFVRNGSQWVQQAYLKASNTGAGDWFGVSVAIADDTVVVGAQGEDSAAVGVNGIQGSNSATSAGAAYVFVRSGPTWTQQAYLKASNTAAEDSFGGSVSITGDTVVVGALNEDSSASGVNGNQNDNGATDSGAVYVFARSGSTWTQQAYVKASNTEAIDNFGVATAVAFDTLVVGARFEDSNAIGVNGNQSDNSAPGAGAAYVFVRNGSSWSQQAYLKASNTGTLDGFAESVAIDGDTVVVGAEREDSAATGVNGDQGDAASDAGAAYVFVRNGTTWSQQAYVKASNTEAIDEFGSSVAVSGDTLVVAAHFEDSGVDGVNGDQLDNSQGGSGAAYVFARTGTTWSQQAYLKASNSSFLDEFGAVAAVSGTTVVVGAPFEDSMATGVNGDPSDDTATNSGAVFIFADCAPAATATAYGASKPGTLGFPVLFSTKAPRVNTTADLAITGGLPGASPVLFAGFSPLALPFDGGTLLVNPNFTLPLPAFDGTGTLLLPIPVTAWACGFQMYFQAMFVDSGAAGFHHTAQTNGLAWTIGG